MILSPTKSLFFVAGEPSGDQRGAELMHHLKQLDGSLQCSGFGGPLMLRQGLTPGEDITSHAVTGFVEVLRHLSSLKALFGRILNEIKRQKPSAVVLIDYPGLNLRLLPQIKSFGVPVIYYISPQIWAWHQKRVELIRRWVDRLIVLFAFEKEWYARHGVPAVWCGHPLIDALPLERYPPRLTEKDLPKERRVAFLPGSRWNEIKRLWPVLCESAQNLHARFGPRVRLSVVASPAFDAALKQGMIPCPTYLDLIEGDKRYDHLHQCHAAVIASGTATLEAALLNVPMVVVYRTHPLTWMIARSVVKGIPGVALCNIVAGEQIVPELLQTKVRPHLINHHIASFLSPETSLPLRRQLHEHVRQRLGPPGASRRAAEAVLDFLCSQ